MRLALVCGTVWDGSQYWEGMRESCENNYADSEI